MYQLDFIYKSGKYLLNKYNKYNIVHAPGTKNKSPLAFMYSAVLVGVLLLSYDEWIWKGVDMEKERQQQQHKGRI